MVSHVMAGAGMSKTASLNSNSFVGKGEFSWETRVVGASIFLKVFSALLPLQVVFQHRNSNMAARLLTWWLITPQQAKTKVFRLS